MEKFLVHVPWKEVFVPDHSLLEIFLRGSVVYLALFFLLRMVQRRQTGSTTVSDLLVVVLIADAAQNAMASDYKSIPDGLILVATLVFWNLFLDWLAYRFRPVERFLHHPPLLLVREGIPLWQHLRREMITLEELMTQARVQGVSDLREIKEAYMEGNGNISVLPRDPSRRE